MTPVHIGNRDTHFHKVKDELANVWKEKLPRATGMSAYVKLGYIGKDVAATLLSISEEATQAPLEEKGNMFTSAEEAALGKTLAIKMAVV